MQTIDLFGGEGEALRDEGIKQAVDHADEKTPNWSDMAFEKVREFTQAYPHLEFMTEELRAWAYHKGLPEPTHGRAWGSIMVRAANKNIIEKVRITQVKNPKAHCANANLWKSK